MQAVAVGFVIGVIWDSVGSLIDALFTAVAKMAKWRKQGKVIAIKNA